MTNLEKYQKAFCDTLDVTPDKLAGLKYQAHDMWDSVGHMMLMTEMEQAFDIMMETDDIVDFSSYEKGMEILAWKYGVNFDE